MEKMDWGWVWWGLLTLVASVLWLRHAQIREWWAKRSKEKVRRQLLGEVHALMRQSGIEPLPKAPPLPGLWRSKYKSYACPKCDYTIGGLSVPLRRMVADGKCPSCAVTLRLRRCNHADVTDRRGGIFQCRACGQIVERA
ncbi:MAG: hypothetical protein ACYCZT_10505 [Thiobacillus sp.]